jgi:general secretion pathway protein A
MYEKYFGLNKSPFLMTPDPSALLLTAAHREALAGLSYGALNRKGFVVLTGEAGTGKTTLVRRLLELGAEADARCSVVFNPLLTPAEFLELLLINFGVRNLPASKALRLVKLEQLLNETHAAGKAAVLIVDEAHKLSYEVFEEIRLLTNFETSEQKLLQIVLSGQPELTRVLSHPNLWQLKQRIAVRVHIDPLHPEDVRAFIQHRWTRAGGAMPHPFTEEAISLIALWSQGIPRLVNSLCDNSLMQVIGQNGKTVGADEIAQVIVDLDLPVPLRRIRVADAERARTALAWSRQAGREMNGTLEEPVWVEPEAKLSGQAGEQQPSMAPERPQAISTGPAYERSSPRSAIETPLPSTKPILPAARVAKAEEIAAVKLTAAATWNGRSSNGNSNGHSHDRVRIRRVSRYEPAPQEPSLINKLFARLGIPGQKLA